MIAADYSPPSVPTIDQQRDALRKGLGRAVLWAKAGRLDDEPLLAACLEDQRHDTQLDDLRGGWLWQLIQTVGAIHRFHDPIFLALFELKDERSANQLCELGCLYASAGDRRFRDRLYEIVETKPFPERPWLGEDEILRIDGEAAFLSVARVRGLMLMKDPDAWEDPGFLRTSDERLGEGRALALMDGSTDPAIRLLHGYLKEREQAEVLRKQENAGQNPRRSPMLDQVLAEARTDGCRSLILQLWGRGAEEADLASVFHYMKTASESSVIANLLRVFMKRPVPQFVEPLIEIAQHPDAEVQERALIALAQIDHPLVREFALNRLGHPDQAHRVVGLLRKNFRPGDEQRILDAVEIPEDEGILHGFLMDLIRLLVDQPGSDRSTLGLMAYALNSCGLCRIQAAELLINAGVAPDWLWEECRFDSSEEIRDLVTRRPSAEDPEDAADGPD